MSAARKTSTETEVSQASTTQGPRMLIMESDLGSGPSTEGATANGSTFELYVKPYSIAFYLISPSPEHTLLPLSLPYGKIKATFVRRPSCNAVRCGKGSPVLQAQRT